MNLDELHTYIAEALREIALGINDMEDAQKRLKSLLDVSSVTVHRYVSEAYNQGFINGMQVDTTHTDNTNAPF